MYQSSASTSATNAPAPKLPAMEEAQIEQLRASYRGQRSAIRALKKKLYTEHQQRLHPSVILQEEIKC